MIFPFPQSQNPDTYGFILLYACLPSPACWAYQSVNIPTSGHLRRQWSFVRHMHPEVQVDPGPCTPRLGQFRYANWSATIDVWSTSAMYTFLTYERLSHAEPC